MARLFSPPLLTLFLSLLLCALAPPVLAQPLFYLLGSNTGGSVALRWGVVEGAWPADLVAIRLRESERVLLETELAAALPQERLQHIWRGAREAQRVHLQHIVAEVSGNEALGAPLSSVVQLLQDPFMRHQLAKKHWLAAQLAGLGWADDAPPSSGGLYLLEGKNQQGQWRRLAQVEVSANTSDRLPAAQALTVFQQAECTAPEYALDHGVLNLSWYFERPSSLAESLYQQLGVAGLALYRSAAPIEGDLPIRDLASESPRPSAAAIPEFDDLVAVSDVLIDFDSAHYGHGWHWSLSEGIEAGQRYAVYLVAQDYSGRLGQTAAAILTVPDTRPPPTPWGIETGLVSPSSTAQGLSWSAIHLTSAQQHWGNRQWCAGGTYVPSGQECRSAARVAPNLDVESFVLYRFDTFAEASVFSDSDGDGHGDAQDTEVCVAQSALGADAVGRIDNPGAEVLRVAASDPEPVNHYGQVYWYRIAAIGSNGVPSPLSAPYRINAPDWRRPETGSYTLTRFDAKNGTQAVDWITGDDLETDLTLTITPPAGHCATLFLRVDQQFVVHSTSCAQEAATLEHVLQPGDFDAFYVVSDTNNNTRTVVLPRSRVVDTSAAQAAPQIESLELVDGEAQVRWRNGGDLGTLLRLERQDAQAQLASTETQVYHAPQHGPSLWRATLPDALTETELWCVTAKSLARPGSEAGSDWSPRHCQRLARNAPAPDYLPWPEVGAFRPQTAWPAQCIDQHAAIVVAQDTLQAGKCNLPLDIRPEISDSRLRGCFVESDEVALTWQQPQLLVFRQRRKGESEVRDYTEITPWLERVHWHRFTNQANEAMIGADDPWFFIARNLSVGNAQQDTLLWRDPEPAREGYEARYLLLRKDVYGAVRSVFHSDWMNCAEDAP